MLIALRPATSRRLVLATTLTLAVAGCSPTPTTTLHVAAAAGLGPAFDDLAEAYRRETGETVVLSYGASVDLTQQIRNGAPYDLFASADPALIDALVSEGLIEGTSRRIFARGELALVVLPAWADSLDLGLPLLADPAIQAIAIADPEHAPFGAAARRALRTAGWWDPLQPKIVYGGSVRHALELIETANAQAGLISVSLLAETELPWRRLPLHLYEPPSFAVGVRLPTDHAQAARRFLDLLTGETGTEVLVAHGLLPGAP